MIIDEIKNIKETKKDLKKFGITVGTVLILIAAVLFWNQKDGYIYFGIIGILLVLAGLIKPVILRPLNKAWMTLAILMGWVMYGSFLKFVKNGGSHLFLFFYCS
ncbi:MAG: hypothetical protein P8Z35_03420 [Ignavibacteriaceae bacterium]